MKEKLFLSARLSIAPALMLNIWQLLSARGERILLSAILIIFSLSSPLITVHASNFLVSSNLDEDASQWGVFTEGNPTWSLNNVSNPSLDGRSLRCAITGGDPYSNVHCYRDLAADPNSNTFTLSISFYYQPPSSFNNVGEPSIVQALEFTMNKWHQGKRYEWALQWDNVDNGAPKWRYWDPAHSPKWVDLGITGVLVGKQWHTLTLEGEILAGQVHYQRFTIDGQVYSLDITVAPASAMGEPDKLAVAVQLDGNYIETPYELFLDHVNFAHDPAANTKIYIGGTVHGTYLLSASESTRQSYNGVNHGPVKITNTNNISIIAAERVIYDVGGVTTSFSELMALPNKQLDKIYWLPWYNNIDLDTQLRFGNVAGSTASVHVYIGGVEMPGSPFTLLAGQSTRLSFTGVNNGPVQIVSNVNIVAAERVIYKLGGIPISFSEMMAMPNSQLNRIYWLPWYNNVDLDTQLRFGNVSGSTATVHVYIGGVEMSGSPFTLLVGQSTRLSFAGVNNGPVQIISNANIVAAERVIYKVGGIPTSFSEMMALPNIHLNTIYWLPWYNNVDLDTQLRFGNVGGPTATVHVYIGGVEMAGSPLTLLSGQSTRVSFAGVNSGPVQIVSNVNIVAAERVIYKILGNPTSFSEMMALPNGQLDSTYWLPWYNNIDLDTQLRFGVP